MHTRSWQERRSISRSLQRRRKINENTCRGRAEHATRASALTSHVPHDGSRRVPSALGISRSNLRRSWVARAEPGSGDVGVCAGVRVVAPLPIDRAISRVTAIPSRVATHSCQHSEVDSATSKPHFVTRSTLKLEEVCSSDSTLLLQKSHDASSLRVHAPPHCTAIACDVIVT